MEKEPLKDSERMKFFLGGLLAELLIIFVPQTGLVIDAETLRVIAVSVAGLVCTMIYSRTIRNTPTS